MVVIAGWGAEKRDAEDADCATIYHLGGVDRQMTVPDQTGRPVHISLGGTPIGGVVA